MLFPPVEVDKWRLDWPICQSKIYVNHAAVSPFSSRVQQAIVGCSQFCAQSELENFDYFAALKERVRHLAANLLHCDFRNVGFVKNTSDGLSILTSGLDWSPGDRIIVPAWEFPSNLYPFLHCRQKGVEIDLVPSQDGTIRIADIEKMITPRTRLISTSFVQFHNGFRQDIARLGRLCRERNIIFCVDSIQGLGAIPFYVEDWKVDFLSNGGHKWLMAPAGVGIVYIDPGLLDKLNPTRIGWLSVKDPWTFGRTTIDFEEGPRRFETGNENWLGMAGMEASLEWLSEIGTERIFEHILALQDIVIERLRSLPVQITTPLSESHRSGILSFRPLGSEDKAAALHSYLKKNAISCSLRENSIRLSPHFYNTPAEMTKLTDVIERGLS